MPYWHGDAGRKKTGGKIILRSGRRKNQMIFGEIKLKF